MSSVVNCSRCKSVPIIETSSVSCPVCKISVQGESNSPSVALQYAMEGWNKLNSSEIPFERTIYLYNPERMFHSEEE